MHWIICSFIKNNQCVDILKEILVSKGNYFQNKSSNCYKSRYCNQNNFKVIIVGDNMTNILNGDVNQIDGSNLRNVKVLPAMIQERRSSQEVC